MSFDPVPWFIGGGAEHSPEVCRLLPYVATLGSEGVVGGTDMKVQALGVPGAGFTVDTGACVIRNRSAGGGQQSYMARMASQHTFNGLTAVGGAGGRSDLVVARVTDPQYSPWTPPVDPLVGPYVEIAVIENVPAGTTSAEQLNLGYSAIALARLDRPAGSTTLSASHIVDVRQIVISRQEREIELGFPAVAVTNNAADNTYKTMWTSGTTINVPEWATTALLMVNVSGIAVMTASSFGRLRASLNGIGYTQETTFDENWTGSYSRTGYVLAGRIAIPADKRGTTCSVVVQGMRTAGTGRIQFDTGTTIVADVQFQERVE